MVDVVGVVIRCGGIGCCQETEGLFGIDMGCVCGDMNIAVEDGEVGRTAELLRRL